MDSDSDKSLTDFKNPDVFSVQKTKIATKKNPRKLQVTKRSGTITRYKPCNKTATHFANKKKAVFVSSDQDKSSDYSCGIETRDKVYPRLLAKSGLNPCTTCGFFFDAMELVQHTPACLRANFEACKSASRNPGSIEDVGGNSMTTTSADPYFCMSCACDLSTLSTDQRNTHINRCVDHNMNKKSDLKTDQSIKQKQALKKKSQSVKCPFCLKNLTSRGLKRHLVACQKKNKFSTITALALHRPEVGEVVDDELLAEIRKSETRPTEVIAPANPLKAKKKGPRKQRMKKTIQVHNAEMMQLAIAVSNNEDLEKRKPRKSKKKQGVIPVMITLSPDSKRQQLKHRLHNIAHLKRSTTDEDILSTPVLPATSLRVPVSNIQVIPNLKGRELAYIDDDRPGPSGLVTHREQRNETHPSRAGRGQDFSSCPSPAPVIRQNSLSFKLCDDELQSPEVSSTNMKNNTSYESVEGPGTNGVNTSNLQRQERGVMCDKTDNESVFTLHRHSPLKPKWTVAKSSEANVALFHVPGLLSQFDERRRGLLVSLADRSDDTIDSTLFTLEALDKDANEGKAKQDFLEFGDFADPHNAAQTQLPFSSQPVGTFVKLINNRQFSDARIIAGDNETIYLHKNILFCSCPLLLKEIISSDNDILSLQEYTKPEILPMIDYVYSKRIEVLVTAALSQDFSMTAQLIERFGVDITDCNKDMLDAAIKEQLRHCEIFEVPKSMVVDDEHQSVPSSPERLEKGSVKDTKKFKACKEASVKRSHVDQQSPMESTRFDLTLPPLTQRFQEELKSYKQSEEVASDSDIFDLGNSDNSDDQDAIEIASSLPYVTTTGLVSRNESRPAKVRDTLSSGSTTEQKCALKFSSVEDSKISFIEKDFIHPSSKPVKRKHTYESPVSVRKSYRRSSSARRRHSNWKTRRCSCCTDVTVGIEDMIPGLVQKRNIHERLSLTDRRSSKGYLQSSKRKTISVGKKSFESSISYPSKISLTKSKRNPRSKPKPENIRSDLESTISRAPMPIKEIKSVEISNIVNVTAKHIDTPEPKISRITHTGPFAKGNGPTKSQSFNGLTSYSRIIHKDVSFESPASQSTLLQKNKAQSGIIKSAILKESSFLDGKTSDGKMNYQDADPKCDRHVSKNHSEDEVHRYVTERLPRFKQREYIKNRPGVANMGKTFRVPKTSKKNQIVTCKMESHIKMDGIDMQSDMPSNTHAQSGSLTEDEKIGQTSSDCKSYSVTLSDYAHPSPLKSTPGHQTSVNNVVRVCTNESSYDLTDSFFDDSFEKEGLNTPKLVESIEFRPPYSSSPINRISGPVYAQHEDNLLYSSQVLITPMPNFKGITTPELLQRAKDVGLKQRLGKAKIRKKLEEVYLYNHQIFEDACTDAVGSDSTEEDDLRTSFVEETKIMHKLSGMSASTSVDKSMKIIYSFSELTKEEVLNLSTVVVDAMHLDGSLLKVLEEMREKTGSIKRGSQQDHKRCWAMVTPGPGYNAKLNALLRLPEDYITAITNPFVCCVVKHYIEYKKYQFECLPAVCDRMEEVFIRKTTN